MNLHQQRRDEYRKAIRECATLQAAADRLGVNPSSVTRFKQTDGLPRRKYGNVVALHVNEKIAIRHHLWAWRIKRREDMAALRVKRDAEIQCRMDCLRELAGLLAERTVK